MTHEKEFQLNDSIIAEAKEYYGEAGVSIDYLAEQIQYPPKGPILLPKEYDPATAASVWELAYEAAVDKNPWVSS